VVWLAQLVPSQESDAPEPEVLPPTASQKVAETHDTPLRKDTPERREAVSFTQVVPPSVVS
jgi:hypothetical protein